MIRRVAVLGSSISMLVRPREGLPYPRILERLLNDEGGSLWLVDNISTIAATIDDLPAHLPRLIADRPEAVVLHYGHVEPIFRPHSRAEWYRTFGVNIGDSTWLQRIRSMERTVARRRQRVGLVMQWTPIERFERVLSGSLAYLRKETAARLIVVEANPGSAKIDAWGSGSTDAIERCNEMMRRVAHDHDAAWLDLATAFGDSLTDATPDGTHFTAGGHEALARALVRQIYSEAPAGRAS